MRVNNFYICFEVPTRLLVVAAVLVVPVCVCALDHTCIPASVLWSNGEGIGGGSVHCDGDVSQRLRCSSCRCGTRSGVVVSLELALNLATSNSSVNREVQPRYSLRYSLARTRTHNSTRTCTHTSHTVNVLPGVLGESGTPPIRCSCGRLKRCVMLASYWHFRVNAGTLIHSICAALYV